MFLAVIWVAGMTVAGGGSDKITVSLRACIPVGNSVNAKAALPEGLWGGAFSWKVVAGAGVVKISFPENPADRSVCVIEGVKPGSIQIVADYVKKDESGKLVVLSSSDPVSSTVDEVRIFPASITAVEAEPSEITLIVIPPPDPNILGFQINNADLDLINKSDGSVILTQDVSPSSFVQDPYNPNQFIFETSFTPPAGTAGVTQLFLRFTAETQVDDPVSGNPILIPNVAEAPVVVLPAEGPAPAVSITTPSTPFEVNPGAATSINISIVTPSLQGTQARMEIGPQGGLPDRVESINLAAFEVSGNTMTGMHAFAAPQSAGFYFVRVVVETSGGPASAEVQLIVTQPMQPPAVAITTPSPVTATEGDPVSISFQISPAQAQSLITNLEWYVRNAAGNPVYGEHLDPAALTTAGGMLLGQVSFVVPEGIVTQTENQTFIIQCDVSGYGPAITSIMLIVSPKPPVPVNLTIYTEPQSPVFEGEDVEFNFLISPKTILSDIDSITYEILDAGTGAQLFASNVDLSTLFINDHILGAAAFTVQDGWHTASGGTGMVEVVVSVIIDGQVRAEDSRTMTVLNKPIMEIATPSPVQLEEGETATINFAIAPDQVTVADLRWTLSTTDGAYTLAAGVLNPASLVPGNGVLNGSFEFLAPAGSAPYSRNPGLILVITAQISGFAGIVEDGISVEVEEPAPPQQLEVKILNPEPMQLGEYQQYPVYLKINGIEAASELKEVYLTLTSGSTLLVEHSADLSAVIPWQDGFALSFYIFVPRGTAGLDVEAAVVARTSTLESVDTAAGSIAPYPRNRAADLVLLSEDFFRVPVNSTHGPVRVQALDIFGDPVAGEEISFALNDPMAGGFFPATATTGQDGVAQSYVSTYWFVCFYFSIISVPNPPPTPGPVPPPGPNPGPVPTPPAGKPTRTGGKTPVPLPTWFFIKIYCDMGRLGAFVDAKASGGSVAGLKSSLDGLYSACMAGDEAQATGIFDGVVSTVRGMISGGEISEADGKHLLYLTANTDGINGVINQEMIPDDLTIDDFPECVPTCCPVWGISGTNAGGREFLGVTADQRPDGSFPDKLVLRVGDVLLLTAPNDNPAELSGKCHPDSHSGGEDKEAAGDLPVVIWEDLESSKGRLHYKKMYNLDFGSGPTPVHGLLGLYEAPCPEKDESSGDYSKPDAPGMISVKAKLLPNQAIEENHKIDFFVIGVDSEVKWNKGDELGAGPDELLVFTASVKAGDEILDGFDDYIDWALDGKIVGKGKKLRIRLNCAGNHAVQAWVGLSRSSFRKFWIKMPGVPLTTEDLKEMEAAVMDSRINRRKTCADGIKAYVDRQADSWREYRLNRWNPDPKPGRHASPTCSAAMAFSNKTLGEVPPGGGPKPEIIGVIRGWLHAPRWFDPGWDGANGFSPTVTIPAQGIAHLNLAAGDLDVMKRIDCVHGGSNQPRNEDYSSFGERYEHRFGDYMIHHWTGPGFDATQAGPMDPRYMGGSSAGANTVVCRIKNQAGSRIEDPDVEVSLALNLFGVNLAAKGNHATSTAAGEIQENTDDDDGNKKADLDQDAAVPNEDDLLEVYCSIEPALPWDGSVRIRWNRNLLGLWTRSDKGIENEYARVVEPGQDEESGHACMDIHVSEVSNGVTFWVEGKRITEESVSTEIYAEYIGIGGRAFAGGSITVAIKKRKAANLVICYTNGDELSEREEENPGSFTIVYGPSVRMWVEKDSLDDPGKGIFEIRRISGADKVNVFRGGGAQPVSFPETVKHFGKGNYYSIEGISQSSSLRDVIFELHFIPSDNNQSQKQDTVNATIGDFSMPNHALLSQSIQSSRAYESRFVLRPVPNIVESRVKDALHYFLGDLDAGVNIEVLPKRSASCEIPPDAQSPVFEKTGEEWSFVVPFVLNALDHKITGEGKIIFKRDDVAGNLKEIGFIPFWIYGIETVNAKHVPSGIEGNGQCKYNEINNSAGLAGWAGPSSNIDANLVLGFCQSMREDACKIDFSLGMIPAEGGIDGFDYDVSPTLEYAVFQALGSQEFDFDEPRFTPFDHTPLDYGKMDVKTLQLSLKSHMEMTGKRSFRVRFFLPVKPPWAPGKAFGNYIDVHIWFIEPDLDVDSNNNGRIEATDDPIEAESPGKIIGLNCNDENGNGIPDCLEPISTERFLTQRIYFVDIDIHISPVVEGAVTNIKLVFDSAVLRVYERISLFNPFRWSIREISSGDIVHSIEYGLSQRPICMYGYYAEGHKTGTTAVKLNLSKAGNTQETYDEVAMSIATIKLVEMKGLYKHDGSYEDGYTSVDNMGRVYSNRLPDGTKEDDKQYVECMVKVEPAYVLNDKSRVFWQSEDPDDPSSNTIIDPNLFLGNDNLGELEAAIEESGNYPFTMFDDIYGIESQTRTSVSGSVRGTAMTMLDGNGKSKAVFNVTDAGGDNFKINVELYIDGSTSIGCNGGTGVFTTWKRIDVELKKMGEAYALPTNPLITLMKEVHVELDVHDMGNTPNYKYLNGIDNNLDVDNFVEYYFSNQDEKQWHFICGARCQDDYNDFNPSTSVNQPPFIPGQGRPLNETAYRAINGGLIPDGYLDKWLMPNTSQAAPSWTQRLDFPILRNTSNIFIVSKLSGFGGMTYSVKGNPIPGAKNGDTFEVTQDRLCGLASKEARWCLVFVETVNNHSLADSVNIDFNLNRDTTTCHEFIHTFDIDHLCGKLSINGIDPCIMQWTTTPIHINNVIKWQNLKNGAIKLCPEHMLAVRKSDGY